MSNISKVTEKQRAVLTAQGEDAHRKSMTLVKTRDGSDLYVREQDATCWRCYEFIERACTYEFISDTAQGTDLARQAARTFGEFHQQLDDLPPDEIHESIIGFHHTPSRLEQLEAAVASDPEGRQEGCKKEIEYARSLKTIANVLVDAMAAGEIPVRVCHNDTKINNILFDYSGPTDTAMTVIDLDTVMPGTMLYDFGDLVRTSTWPGAEDEADASKVYVSMELFEALVRGWLGGAGEIMKDREVSYLPLAGRLITYNIGLRFLTDYLNGDKYFATQREGQNLDRARVQFAMIRDMERNKATMERIAGVAAAELRP